MDLILENLPLDIQRHLCQFILVRYKTELKYRYSIWYKTCFQSVDIIVFSNYWIRFSNDFMEVYCRPQQLVNCFVLCTVYQMKPGPVHNLSIRDKNFPLFYYLNNVYECNISTINSNKEWKFISFEFPVMKYILGNTVLI
jgi:hypothetical protein